MAFGAPSLARGQQRAKFLNFDLSKSLLQEGESIGVQKIQKAIISNNMLKRELQQEEGD